MGGSREVTGPPGKTQVAICFPRNTGIWYGRPIGPLIIYNWTSGPREPIGPEPQALEKQLATPPPPPPSKEFSGYLPMSFIAFN